MIDFLFRPIVAAWTQIWKTIFETAVSGDKERK